MDYRVQFYQRIENRRERILDRIREVPAAIGFPDELRQKVGLLGGSGLHAPPRRSVLEAIEEGSGSFISAKGLNHRLRVLVKEIYGDEWDAAAVSSGEAALQVVIDTLMSPPLAARGSSYRARYIAPYERHIHHQAAYGTPFPPRYKDLTSERGVTSGEFGMLGKRLANLDVVLVRLSGARYEVHGIRQFVCPLLGGVDAAASAERIRRAAETHAPWLSGFASMGYDTPGYGHGQRDADGTPALQQRIGKLAEEFGVPYLVDNARGMPFIGNDPRALGADIMIYSTDKAFSGPTGGLIIGRDESMVQVRRALGMHGSRSGSVESHGKAGYVGFDPGKEALIGIISSLELIREDPDSFTCPVDQMHELAQEEFSNALPADVYEGLQIGKSYNSLTVEVDYAETWSNGEKGIPIFSIEDMYAGSNLIQAALPAMGLLSGMIAYDGNIILAPGMGTTDEQGALIPENATYALRSLAHALAIIHEEAHCD